MMAIWVRKLGLALFVAAGLSACAGEGVQPGVVNTSAAAPVAGVGDSGRVVSIREVGLRGGGGPGSGPGNGTVMGGVIGGLGGAAIGGATSRSVGGGLVGLLIGAVGGAIAGTIVDRQSGVGRGIEVTVQKDSGATVTVAQRDDGDVQLGDRVQVVTDRNGVSKAVRNNSDRPVD